MNAKHIYYRTYQKVMKFSVNFLDWTPPKLLKGAGAIKELPELVKSQGISNVLVVTDKGEKISEMIIKRRFRFRKRLRKKWLVLQKDMRLHIRL